MSRLCYGRLIEPRKGVKPWDLRNFEHESAIRCQALKIIRQICEEKRLGRREPVLATYLEVVNRYEGSTAKLKTEIDRLVRFRFIERTRTINYEAYRIRIILKNAEKA